MRYDISEIVLGNEIVPSVSFKKVIKQQDHIISNIFKSVVGRERPSSARFTE